MVEVDEYLENKIKNGRILENRYQEEKIIFVNKNNKIVGKYIRETISNTQNPICSLQNISKAIYVVKYCVFSNDDIYELAKITNCDSSEVMECFKLKRIIEENIYKK